MRTTKENKGVNFSGECTKESVMRAIKDSIPYVKAAFGHIVDICNDGFKSENKAIRPSGFFVIGDVVDGHEADGLMDVAGTTYGKEEDVVSAFCIAMDRSPQLLDMVTKAWVSSFVRNTFYSEDKTVKEVRRNIIRLFGRDLVRSNFIPERTQREEADDVITQIALDHPDRESRYPLLRARAKQYRKAGLRDMEQMMLREVERLKEEIETDEQCILSAETDRQHRLNIIKEARRVRAMMQQEDIEQQRLEHDFDHIDRRVRAYNLAIDRLQHERERILAEQNALQAAHPQFDPNSAARQRRKQIAARQRERNAMKRKSSADSEMSVSSSKNKNRSRHVKGSCSTLFG